MIWGRFEVPRSHVLEQFYRELTVLWKRAAPPTGGGGREGETEEADSGQKGWGWGEVERTRTKEAAGSPAVLKNASCFFKGSRRSGGRAGRRRRRELPALRPAALTDLANWASV